MLAARAVDDVLEDQENADLLDPAWRRSESTYSARAQRTGNAAVRPGRPITGHDSTVGEPRVHDAAVMPARDMRSDAQPSQDRKGIPSLASGRQGVALRSRGPLGLYATVALVLLWVRSCGKIQQRCAEPKSGVRRSPEAF
jgi:hypothetical protein